MKELAAKMLEAFDHIVMEEIYIIHAASNYCLANNIDLTEDEECELLDILMEEIF